MTPMGALGNSVRAAFALAVVVPLLVGCATTGKVEPNAGVLAATASEGLASVLASALYAPAKLLYATTGTVVGGGAYVLSGGNKRVAAAVIGPAVDGHYIVTPERLRNPESLEFVGVGYDVVGRREDPAHAVAPPAVAAAPPRACAELGVYPNVFFESGQTGLDAGAKQSLDRAAAVLRDCPTATAEIRAFSDALGSREVNYALSRRRAQAVRDFLVKGGVADDRLRILPFGEENPVAINATKAGRAANRRVEVTLR